MPKRKILKDFELTEISSVDRPAQPTATMAIIKRRSASFDKASRLGAKLTSLRDEKELSNSDLAAAAGISEATLSDILSGDIASPPERRIRGFARALGVSFESLEGLVPREEKEAVKSFCRKNNIPLDRILDADSEADVTTAIVKAFCLKSDGHARTFAETLLADRVTDSLWPMTNALSSTIHSILADDDTPGKAAAVGQAIDDFGVRMRSVVDDAESPLTKFAMNLIAGNIGDTTGEETTMPNKTPEEIELQKQLDTATAELAGALLIAKLNDDEKAFMEGMDDKARKAFTALTTDERKGKMDLTKRADETLEVDGTTISKNVVGADMFAVIKSQQGQIAESKDAVAKAQDDAVTATMTKRASDEFSHLPGTPGELAAVLKHLEGAPEAVRTTVEAVFKSAEGIAAATYLTQGHGQGQTVISGTATEQLDTLAKAHAKDKSIDYASAYSEVIEKNADLYAQTLDGAQ